MNKSELRSLIREQIKKVLKESKETITFSGDKAFMDRKAMNVLLKNGIDKASIKRAYDPDEGVVELTVMMDDATASKIGDELESLDKQQGKYGGYITENIKPIKRK
jgi:propanediol utilization protein